MGGQQKDSTCRHVSSNPQLAAYPCLQHPQELPKNLVRTKKPPVFVLKNPPFVLKNPPL